MLRTIAIVVSVSLCAPTFAQQSGHNQLRDNQARAHAVLGKYCFVCHGPEDAEADLRIDSLVTQNDFESSFGKWEELLHHLADRSMPPPAAERPDDTEYEIAVNWVRGNLIRAEQIREENKPRYLRRLNRLEYNNTVRDLFGLDLQPGDKLPLDDALEGFDNVAEALVVSPQHVERYLEAAYSVLDEVLVRGPQPVLKSQLFTADFYTTRRGDGTIRVRDGNSLIAERRDAPKHWIGGRFHVRFKGPANGLYRFSFRGVPHQFRGRLAGFVTTVNQADSREWDVTPEDGAKTTIVEFEAWTNGGLIEIQWTENQHGLGEKRPGQSEGESPFRQLQAAKKKFPGDLTAQLKDLNWPYFTDVECEISGPHFEMWPPKTTVDLLAPGSGGGQVPEAKNLEYTGSLEFRPVIEAFLERAFRRPVSHEEVDRFVGIGEAEIAAGESHHESLKHALAAILVSPHFLFLVESPPVDSRKGEYTLNNFELASRLSYFLWSSMPDAALFEAAKNGSLNRPDVLRAQMKRLLDDPKATALTTSFASQWLDTRRIPTLMPEPSLFRHVFDTYVHNAMAREPLEMFDAIRREDRSLVEFLAADYTYVNAPLARFYGMSGVEGQTFRKVPVSDPRRGSLVTQAAFLTLTSEATRTSPVKRGTWILERLFNRPPPPPPPNVGSLNARHKELASIRQQLAEHREVPQCATCHNRIDPFGLALENFNAVGAWREQEEVLTPEQIALPHWKRKPKVYDIDASTIMPGGEKITGIFEFRKYLLTRRNDFVRGLTEKLMIYALGRPLLVRDQPEIEEIVVHVCEHEYKFSALINGIVQSTAFRSR